MIHRRHLRNRHFRNCRFQNSHQRDRCRCHHPASHRHWGHHLRRLRYHHFRRHRSWVGNQEVPGNWGEPRGDCVEGEVLEKEEVVPESANCYFGLHPRSSEWYGRQH